MEIPTEGRVVHLKGYGMVRVFRTVAKRKKDKDGGTEHYCYHYWATDDLLR